jgi:hypothetical protein
MSDEYYYLLDLERTLTAGVPCFWKGNKHGYTYNIEHAGIFPTEIAEEIVKHDHDKRTVLVSVRTVFEILGKDMKAHEGS